MIYEVAGGLPGNIPVSGNNFVEKRNLAAPATSLGVQMEKYNAMLNWEQIAAVCDATKGAMKTYSRNHK